MGAASDRSSTHFIAPLLIVGLFALAPAVRAQEPDSAEREQRILELVKDRDPEVAVDQVDMERLRVRRIDVVDEDGTIRMTIAGVLPDPVVDGVRYQRSVPVSGIMVRDDVGNERGGFGYNMGLDGPMIALDHPTGEGAGFAIQDDGTALSFLGAAREPLRSDSLDGALLPGDTGRPESTVRTMIGPDGRPSLVPTDREGQSRVRITLTEEGHGAIEFLDADGDVVEALVPERAEGGSR